MLAIRILMQVLTAVCAAPRNGIVKTVKPLRGQQSPDSKDNVQNLKKQTSVRGTSEQGPRSQSW